MEISTISEFIQSSAALLNGDIQIEDIKLSKEFTCRITISGAEQQGLVDYGLANFVVLLQRNARSIIRSCLKELPYSNKNELISKVKVKVKVNEGCTIVDILLESIFGGALQSMTGPQVLCAILMMCVTLFGMKGLSVLSEIKKKAKDEETKQRFASIAEKVIEEIPKINETMRTLATTMANGDTIRLEAINRPLKKNEYQRIFKEEKSEQVQTLYIDGEYIIKGVSLDKLYINIEKGAAKFSASTKMLNDIDKKCLFSEIKNAGIKDTTASLELQINLIIEGIDKKFYVMGIGAARNDSVDVENVVSNGVEELPAEMPQQASLFTKKK